MTKNAPKLEEVTEHILSICKGSVFIGHTTKVDVGAMGLEFIDFIDIIRSYGSQPQKL